jgi:DNA-binding NarL/FixJ family response regulator
MTIQQSSARVLIVEDHPLVAAATADLLRKQHPEFQHVVVHSAAAAVERITEPWHRLFLDLNVPGASGLSLVRMIKARGLIERCCIVTATTSEALVEEAKRLGVLGYIEKCSTVESFCESVRRIMFGLPVFPSSTATTYAKAPQLTMRQLAILRLLHEGLSSKQVAQALHIAEGTAKNHTLAILRALGASNRAHAVARGMELGLLDAVT